MKISFICYIFVFSLADYCLGQSSIQGNLVSASQQSTKNNFSIEWILGDIFSETFIEKNFSLSTGLIATNNVLLITSTQDGIEAYRIRSFPNPFVNVLTIESSEFSLNDAGIDFFDVQGKKIELPAAAIQSHKISFSTEHLKSGLYILKIRPVNNRPLIHIKIIRE